MLVVKNKCNMVELSFLKSGSKYICELEVSSDFNLHIEREKGGYLFLYQRSSEGGNYDSVGDAKFAPQDLVVDYDCSAIVYPKCIKIVSEVEPSYAAITTDGEVTEIKSQSKEVEITANGKVDVAPDAGYSYLSKVKVNVNVPQSGGGEGGSNYEYLDLREIDAIDSKYAVLASAAQVFNVNAEIAGRSVSAVLTGTSAGAQMQYITKIKGVSIDFSIKSELQIGTLKTAKEWVLMFLTQEEIDAIPRITEEEFYTI